MRVVEIIPDVRLGEAIAQGKLHTTGKIIVCVEVAGDGLEAADDDLNCESDQKEDEIVFAGHGEGKDGEW